MKTNIQNSNPAQYNTASGVSQKSSTQVSAYLNELSIAIEILEKQIAVHAEKISPVMAGERPKECGDSVSPDEALCPVAEQLRRHNRRVRQLTDVLGELTSRVEA